MIALAGVELQTLISEPDATKGLFRVSLNKNFILAVSNQYHNKRKFSILVHINKPGLP